MRIVLKSTTGESVLCHGPERGADKIIGPADLEISGQCDAQVVSICRAANVKIYDRGNDRIDVSFTAVYQGLSPSQAALWLVSHLKTLVRYGDLYLVATDGATATLTITNTSLKVRKYRLHGASVPISYQLIGESIS